MTFSRFLKIDQKKNKLKHDFFKANFNEYIPLWALTLFQSDIRLIGFHCPSAAGAIRSLFASSTLIWRASKVLKYCLICGTGSSINIPVIFGAFS